MATTRRWCLRHASSRSIDKPRREPPIDLVYERRSDSPDNIQRRKWFALADIALRTDDSAAVRKGGKRLIIWPQEFLEDQKASGYTWIAHGKGNSAICKAA